ncbi:asparagine synthase-related protein [Bacillus thuringiensis]|uniref:asparagine synthase-related protein n=1 Tax=Bacillus thuringiensis TaxID=1428 RepID=UPI003B984926
MKWFLISVSFEKVDVANHNIQKEIFAEFKKLVTEIHVKVDNYQFSFASNERNLVNEFNFEDVLIVGDIALHNKEEIIKKYNLDKRLDTNIENEKLLVYLYKKNGIEFVEDMVGEFAFILYDQKKQKFYAIRDQMGVRTLFWIKYNNCYIFASDIFLLTKFFNLNDINFNYFKEFHERNGIVDTEITPYNNVYRVPSGGYIISTKDTFNLHKYWDLSCISETIVHKKESDYWEEFSQLLFKSVEDRLIKGMGNSIMLSGGMDSTSIYAIGKNLEKMDNGFRVEGVSAVFDELKECDEREYIYDLINKYHAKEIFLNCDNILLFENFPDNVPFSYEPNVNSISFNFTYNTVKKAVDNGLSNVFSGYAGDHLLTGSLYIARDFLRKGQFVKALSYVTNYSIVNNTSAFENFIQYILTPNILKEHNVVKSTTYYEEIGKKFKNIKHFHQKELYYQMSNAKSHLYTDRVIGAIAGADINHPFLDRRIVEYVYKIPGELRFSEENTKHILRKSMEKHLTPSIVNRFDKTTHLAYIYKSIRQNWDSIFKVMENPLVVEKLNLISPDSWKEEMKKWRNGSPNRNDFWTLFAIELWLIKYYRKLNDIRNN